jgi:hypothetical protein
MRVELNQLSGIVINLGRSATMLENPRALRRGHVIQHQSFVDLSCLCQTEARFDDQLPLRVSTPLDATTTGTCSRYGASRPG